MPPSDQEPRYRLVDSNGNVVGSLFVNASGNVEIQDETATGTVFGPNGIVTPAVDADSVTTDELTNGIHRIDSAGIHFYDTLPTAIAALSESDYLYVPSAVYDPITITTDNVLVQCGGKSETRFDGSDGTAVTISGRYVTMRNFSIEAAGTGSEHGVLLDNSDCTISDCRLGSTGTTGNHIRVTGSRNNIEVLTLTAGSGGDSIVFESGASDNIVDQVTNAGTITDNDGSNATGTIN